MHLLSFKSLSYFHVFSFSRAGVWCEQQVALRCSRCADDALRWIWSLSGPSPSCSWISLLKQKKGHLSRQTAQGRKLRLETPPGVFLNADQDESLVFQMFFHVSHPKIDVFYVLLGIKYSFMSLLCRIYSLAHVELLLSLILWYFFIFLLGFLLL